MDLTILFSPVDESVFANITSSTSFYKSIRLFGEKMPDYKGAHMALFGVKEERGNLDNVGAAQGADEIRKKLYNLKRGNGTYKIVDLGNLNIGHDLNETYVRISEVCRILLESNVLPILIGGTHDLDYGQYCGYETLEKLVSFLNVDAFLDLEDQAAPHTTETADRGHFPCALGLAVLRDFLYSRRHATHPFSNRVPCST